MKITGYKTFLVDAHRTNFIFVKLQTDSGYEGLGKAAAAEWNEKAIVAALEELGEFLVGKDPFQTDYLIQTMHRNSYWRTGGRRSTRHRSRPRHLAQRGGGAGGPRRAELRHRGPGHD